MIGRTSHLTITSLWILHLSIFINTISHIIKVRRIFKIGFFSRRIRMLTTCIRLILLSFYFNFARFLYMFHHCLIFLLLFLYWITLVNPIFYNFLILILYFLFRCIMLGRLSRLILVIICVLNCIYSVLRIWSIFFFWYLRLVIRLWVVLFHNRILFYLFILFLWFFNSLSNNFDFF